MTDNNLKFVEAQLLIRKPVTEVFEAFIDPALTKHFWFTKGSDRLEVGKTITWEWEMYNVSTKVFVKEILPNKKISIDWDEPATSVDFNFKELSDGSTYVTIVNHSTFTRKYCAAAFNNSGKYVLTDYIKHYGFDRAGDELLQIMKDSTGGFTTVLDGLKAFLEHNIDLNLMVVTNRLLLSLVNKNTLKFLEKKIIERN